jgi:hypothetical protein
MLTCSYINNTIIYSSRGKHPYVFIQDRLAVHLFVIADALLVSQKPGIKLAPAIKAEHAHASP